QTQLRRFRGAAPRERCGAARRRERADARRGGAGRGRVSVADDILAWGVRGEGPSVPTAWLATQEHERHDAEGGGSHGPGGADVVGPQADRTDPAPRAGRDEQPRAE